MTPKNLLATDGMGSMSDHLLQESLADLYEQGPCGYVFTSVDGTILRVNDTLLRWIEYAREELVGVRRFQDLLTVPGKLFYENQYFPLLRLQGSVSEVAFDLARRGREALPVLVNSVQRSDESGRPVLIASAVFDASDRRAYEQELIRSRQSAEQLAALVRMSSDAIVSLSATGAITTWNAGAERLFGYATPDIVGTDLHQILAPAQGQAPWHRIMAELRAGHAIDLEMEGSRADGATVDVSVSFTPHPDLLGNLGAVSVIMRDIGERRAIERVQQEFLAVTTHELRTPVTGIRGNAQLMQRRTAYSERAVTAIIAQADRLQRLIDDLLVASQIQADRLTLVPEKTDLVSATRAAVENLGVGESVIRVEAPAEPLMVSADQYRLGQVLGNLLTNAIKYSPAGSEITVRVARQTSEACVSVIDRGVGIPPEALPHLFDRFYRVQGTAGWAPGLGLGLYISRRIVDAHGGRIEVESQPGQGSTFTVTLPMQTGSAASSVLPSHSPEID